MAPVFWHVYHFNYTDGATLKGLTPNFYRPDNTDGATLQFLFAVSITQMAPLSKRLPPDGATLP